ncbi:hypothetical protein ABW21_db0203760 [Orbilia brochopaga]|nr:hypothetical protein ABW21_db0203760 [Drechslerella brochopaga]
MHFNPDSDSYHNCNSHDYIRYRGDINAGYPYYSCATRHSRHGNRSGYRDLYFGGDSVLRYDNHHFYIAARKTTTVTATQPKATRRITSTRTTTVTLAVDVLTNTQTIHDTTTLTSIATSYTTTTSTHTSTDSTTVTVLPASLCDSPYTFNGRNAFSYTNASPSNAGAGVTNLSDCCTRCYNTMNCANYMFDNVANTCTIFTVNDGSSNDRCVNDVCPNGHTSGTFVEQPSNQLYGPGPCGGGIVRS